ncbi:MAG: protein kinase, partial [Candidatus Aminicenantes bacterium]|nr:protein kinase [Candidatus Aminicenantes bacterium]
ASKEIPAMPTETIIAPKKELTTGATFAGRYQVIEELGKGGMGTVYKVFDNEIKEKIALKLLKPEVAADEDTVERFRNEMKLARKIGHKYVCRMYDLGKAEGTYFITMEYVPGEDLKSFIRRSGQLTVGKAVYVARQVLEGLAEAHRLGVVHRDLKPQNIMIDREGNARIMDFGIARSLKAKGITGAGVMIGTPEYMSPEQAEVKDVDQRSDIYSFGVIFYEMLVGRVPFEGETLLGIAMKHKSQPPQNPKELNPQIPDDLNRMVLRCLEKSKEKRYQSAEDMLSDIGKIEKEIPTTDRVIPKYKGFTSKQITVTFGVKKLFVPALIVLFIIASAVIVWRVLPKKRMAPPPPGKPSLAVMYFKNNTGDEKLDHWRAAISDLLITDLSQSRYIKVLSSDQLFNILGEMNQADAKSYTSKVLKEVAARGGVKDVLVGSYAKAGDNFRIDVTLQESGTGEFLSSQRVEGKGEDGIFSMVDELTRKIKADLKLSSKEIASDIDEDLKKITTSSAEAFKFYVEGRKLHNEQKYRESIQMMEKAVAVDSGFAMAYRSMAMSFSNLLYNSEKKKYLQKAFELSDRLSDRERYIIQGDYYRESERFFDKAIAAYEQLLELYPDETMGVTNLGILYNSLEEWDKAIGLYERQIRNRPDNIWAYLNILDSYLAKGWPEKAKAALEGYIKNYQDGFMIRIYLAIIDYVQGQYEAALAEAEKADLLNPAYYLNYIAKGCCYRGLGDWVRAEIEFQKAFGLEEIAGHLVAWRMLGAMYQLRGQFKRAQEAMNKGLELAEKIGDKGWISDFHQSLARIFLGSDQPEKAFQELDKSLRPAIEIVSLTRQKNILSAKGFVELDLGKTREAQKTADALKALIDQDANKKAVRYWDLLAGRMMIDNKDYSGATDRLSKAEALLPFQYFFDNDQVIFMDALALAYFKQGDLDKARKECEKISQLTVGAFYYGDIFAKNFYRLGMICEKQGDKVKARENYQKFLDLWKDADPGRPEVADAKKRLASL